MKYFIDFGALVLLLLLAAFTAASEIAMIAASRVKLRRRSLEGSKTAKTILKILENPGKFFSTILVLNSIAGALVASLVTTIMIRFIGDGAGIILYSTIIVTFLIVVSEVVAKTIAARFSDRLSSYLARPVQLLITVFSPVVRVLEIVTNKIVNVLVGKSTGKPSLITEEEIRALIKIGEEEGVLQKDKYKMLTRVFDLSETIVRSIMKPRVDIMTIDINAPIDMILEKVMESGYSRLPVHKDSPENIIGIINMKDLLNLSINKGLIVLQDIIYPPTFVSGSKKVVDLLKDFQKGHTHIAIVVGDKGVVEGLVTLEDILEEIVGEIEDEYDIRGTAKVVKK